MSRRVRDAAGRGRAVSELLDPQTGSLAVPGQPSALQGASHRSRRRVDLEQSSLAFDSLSGGGAAPSRVQNDGFGSRPVTRTTQQTRKSIQAC